MIRIDNSITPVVADGKYLKIDQTTPQTVINGMPVFNKGVRSDDDVIIKQSKRLVLDG
jgi:hypothetical protein